MPFFLKYCLIINIITFALFAIDKSAAIKNRPRIRNATLLGMAFAGGSVGALLSMYLFRHKTKQLAYTVGIPLMILLQVAVIFIFREYL